MPLATEGTQEHIMIYTMLKHSGSATRLGADSPDERGTTESGVAGVRPRSRSFCCEKLYFGARPGGFALGPDPVRGYLVMARMKVARDMSMEVMVKKMLVEELKKALRASDFLGST